MKSRPLFTNALILTLIFVFGVGALMYADQVSVSGVRKVGLFGQEGASQRYEAIGAYALTDSPGNPSGSRRGIGSYSVTYTFDGSNGKPVRVRGTRGSGMATALPIVHASEARISDGATFWSETFTNPGLDANLVHLRNTSSKNMYIARLDLLGDVDTSLGWLGTNGAAGSGCVAMTAGQLNISAIAPAPLGEKSCTTVTTSGERARGYGALAFQSIQRDMTGIVVRPGFGIVFRQGSAVTGEVGLTVWVWMADPA